MSDKNKTKTVLAMQRAFSAARELVETEQELVGLSRDELACGDVPAEPMFRDISLRDWFAGQALSGVIMDQSETNVYGIAGSAYTIAEAMIDERKRIAKQAWPQ